MAMLMTKIPLSRLAAFLASPEADYITAATYLIDGGLTWNYEEQ